MAILARVVLNDAELATTVEAVKEAFAPDIVRIRYNIGEDWTGAPAIFFRIVLADNALPAKGSNKDLYAVEKRISDRIWTDVKPDELGLQDYYGFRTLSEQAALKESSWE